MKRNYVVKNLFVHRNREDVLIGVYKVSTAIYQYDDERDTFSDVLKNTVIKERHWLNKNSIYDTCYVSELNGHLRLWNKVYLLKDDCKINRRKIYIRPFDEEKYSTQYEDSQIAWSELWKGVE